MLKALVESSGKNGLPEIQEEYAVDDVMAVNNWRLRPRFPSVHRNGRAFGTCHNQLMPPRSFEHARARREYAKFQLNRCAGQPLARLPGYPLSSEEIYEVQMRNQQAPPWARDYACYECGHRGHVRSICPHLMFSGSNRVEYGRREVPRWERRAVRKFSPPPWERKTEPLELRVRRDHDRPEKLVRLQEELSSMVEVVGAEDSNCLVAGVSDVMGEPSTCHQTADYIKEPDFIYDSTGMESDNDTPMIPAKIKSAQRKEKTQSVKLKARQAAHQATIEDTLDCNEDDSARPVRPIAFDSAEGIQAKSFGKKTSGPSSISHFCTTAYADTGKRQFQIQKALIDAGSVVNLMPLSALEDIGAHLKKTNGLVIRTTTSAMVQIDWYADFNVMVAGVTTPLRVYAMPQKYNLSYALLLGRDWLQAVGAQGDYEAHMYYIWNQNGEFVSVPFD
ncbi:hypothetical protein L873DRAFT_1844074 [Choiromyces venosus 120613-1]|uniref:CCHC-type domain-containing protein n=1 Tax=Choiromyces venosus 120613-1 TaxID=1336337 RepID=A0A3N4JNB6_9PEZI|nr:hypothetical protein L873DRAFT_1844074 [Choiromyces venosus 120613-1]